MNLRLLHDHHLHAAGKLPQQRNSQNRRQNFSHDAMRVNAQQSGQTPQGGEFADTVICPLRHR
jgi:hypothetical protein